MGYNYTEQPLYKFCLEEAEFRVKEWEHTDGGATDVYTLADRLKSKGVNVDKFVSEYAEKLYDNAEYWIRGDDLQDYLDELLDDYEVE